MRKLLKRIIENTIMCLALCCLVTSLTARTSGPGAAACFLAIAGRMAGEPDWMARAAVAEMGYSLTEKGGSQPDVRREALAFLRNYLYMEEEINNFFQGSNLVAPILRHYRTPDDLPHILKRKVELGRNNSTLTDVIDVHLTGRANDALNSGCQKIASGKATPEQVAREVETLQRNR